MFQNVARLRKQRFLKRTTLKTFQIHEHDFCFHINIRNCYCLLFGSLKNILFQKIFTQKIHTKKASSKIENGLMYGLRQNIQNTK